MRTEVEAQQARQMSWELQERELPLRYLIHDHDTTFTDAFDTVFESEGMEQDSPTVMLLGLREGKLRYRNTLGGIIRDYSRDAA